MFETPSDRLNGSIWQGSQPHHSASDQISGRASRKGTVRLRRALVLAGVILSAPILGRYSLPPAQAAPRSSEAKRVSLPCAYYGVVVAVGILNSQKKSLAQEAVQQTLPPLIREARSVRRRLQNATTPIQSLAVPFGRLLNTLVVIDAQAHNGAIPASRQGVGEIAAELSSLRTAERRALVVCTKKTGTGSISVGP